MATMLIENKVHYMRVAIINKTGINIPVSVFARLMAGGTTTTALAMSYWEGTLTTGAPQPIDFPFNLGTANLAPGTYIGEVTVKDAQGNTIVVGVGADPLNLLGLIVEITSISWV